MYAAIWLLGFSLATPLTTLLYLRAARERWPISVGLSLAGFAFVYGLFENGPGRAVPARATVRLAGRTEAEAAAALVSSVDADPPLAEHAPSPGRPADGLRRRASRARARVFSSTSSCTSPAAPGRRVHLLQWDVARPVFEASGAGRRYPLADGVTHPVIRKAAGLWVRAALADWSERNRAPEHLLVGETPFVGNRFVELARPPRGSRRGPPDRARRADS